MKQRQTVLRSSVDAETPIWDEADASLLEHASALIATRGTQGLTIAELAREAGVSRPTIYRRWAGTDEVVRAALLRQTVLIIEQLAPGVTTRHALVSEVMRFADLFRDDPVFKRLLDREPGAFTQYSLKRIGSSQRAMLRWLEDALVRGQSDGSVREGTPGDMAVMLLLIVQSAVLSRHAVASLIGEPEWHDELTRAVDGYLRP
ncbi:MAG TPA: TetR/AcrR family transcriptional regulator [Microbacterium sp.]|uniref:TetR/AcrR family transcriptional regulator n=1 Tax=Microbacterium sp. TaxID=51671 RepID=UPI000EEF2454|nr:TetR/AcrR family transcriptional regulator [Microbacterium sp.]